MLFSKDKPQRDVLKILILLCLSNLPMKKCYFIGRLGKGRILEQGKLLKKTGVLIY